MTFLKLIHYCGLQQASQSTRRSLITLFSRETPTIIHIYMAHQWMIGTVTMHYLKMIENKCITILLATR